MHAVGSDPSIQPSLEDFGLVRSLGLHQKIDGTVKIKILSGDDLKRFEQIDDSPQDDIFNLRDAVRLKAVLEHDAVGRFHRYQTRSRIGLASGVWLLPVVDNRHAFYALRSLLTTIRTTVQPAFDAGKNDYTKAGCPWWDRPRRLSRLHDSTADTVRLTKSTESMP